MTWTSKDFGGMILAIMAILGFISILAVGFFPDFYRRFSGNGTSTVPLPVYHWENITATIEYKYTKTDWHLRSIVPFNRFGSETTYLFIMNNDDTTEVSVNDYNSYSIGDNYTYLARRT